MRQGYDPEKYLKEAMALECEGLTVPRDLKARIDERILTGQKEADMKHLSVKKLVIGVAVGCLLVSGGVAAAGHAVSLSTHSWLTDAYRSYGDMDKAQEELGYRVDTVEEFSNGYRFERMSVNDTNGKDEQGNVVYTYKSLAIHYEKGREPSVSLCVAKPVEAVVRTGEPEAVRQVGEITVYYDSTTYKFVPPDYEVTDEDKARLEKDNFTISYGSSEVEEKQSSDVTWYKDGIFYHLLGFDVNMSPEEMLDMAEEIITGE